MPAIVEILGLPLLGCILTSSILGYLGIHVLKREVIFIDIAMAQIAAVGSVAAHLIFEAHGDSPTAYICSFGCVLIAAAFYAFLQNKTLQISLEAIIGISYALAAAGVLLLVGIAPGGHTHMQDILSGSLLWTGWRQIIISAAVFLIAAVCFYLCRKPIEQVSNNYRENISKNSRAVFWDFIFYALLGIIVTVSVQLGGIVVVFAYLIIPAAIAAILSTSLHIQLIIIWTTAIAASLAGLVFAYYLDFSVGPAIALFLGLELIIVSVFHRFRRPCLQPD